MIDQIFIALSDAMNGSAWIVVLASFAWGILSILLSPCHLTSIPLIVGYVTSRGRPHSGESFNLALFFSFGIMVTITLIGVCTALLGRMLGDIGSIGNYVVAGILFVVGFYLVGVIKFSWSSSVKKIKMPGLLGAFILGIMFGLAVGPCTFAYMAPVLGIVFQTAQTNYMLAIVFLLAFGLGHCSVIVGAGTLTGKVQKYLNWSEESHTIVWIKRTCGILVILGGIYLIYNIS